MLKAWYQKHETNLNAVRVLDHEIVDLDTPEGQTTYTEVNKRAVQGGYEGIMIKDLEAPYECKRSHAWLKLKPFIEVSLEIKATEEGTGRNVGKLGGRLRGAQAVEICAPPPARRAGRDARHQGPRGRSRHCPCLAGDGGDGFLQGRTPTRGEGAT